MAFSLPIAPWLGQTAPLGGPTPGAGFLAAAQAWSTIILGMAVLGVLAVSVVLLLQLRRLTGALLQRLDRLERDAAPFLEKSRQVAENLAVITQTAREEAVKFHQTVSRLNHRLQETSQAMEKRVQEFSALLDLLQAEAEELALDTAAAVRGLRAGARTLGGGAGSGTRAEPPESGGPEAVGPPLNHPDRGSEG